MTRVTHSHTASVVTLQQASGFVWNDPISIFVQQLAYTFFQQLAYTYMYNARPSTCTECVACTTRPGLAALDGLHYQARTGSTGWPALPGQDWQHWEGAESKWDITGVNHPILTWNGAHTLHSVPHMYNP